MTQPSRRSILLSAASPLLGTGLARANEAAAQAITVQMVSEPWAHLLYSGRDGRAEGPMADFIARMNAVQPRFRFELSLVPRLRVDLLLAQGQAHVYPFRTLAWTDPKLGLLASRTLLQTGDLYIARRDNALGGARVFDDLARRSLAGVRGYHYGLFGNNADPAYIHRHFKAQLLASNEAVLAFVQLGRAEVGIVPELIVAKALRDPVLREQLIVAKQFDSRVELSHLLRPDGPISVAEMNAVVDPLIAAGALAPLRAELLVKS